MRSIAESVPVQQPILAQGHTDLFGKLTVQVARRPRPI